MRTYEDFEGLIYSGGDLLFSAILSVTGSREKALEVIIEASEKYIECGKKLKNANEKYRYMAKICEKLLKTPLPSEPAEEFLTDEERDKVLAAARMYISSGGKSRKRLWVIITVGVLLLIAAVILAYELHFILSDEFDFGWKGWFRKEEVNRPGLFKINDTIYPLK